MMMMIKNFTQDLKKEKKKNLQLSFFFTLCGRQEFLDPIRIIRSQGYFLIPILSIQINGTMSLEDFFVDASLTKN